MQLIMWQAEQGAAVPKFGDWDENNPASADGFTHIFNKVREERQNGGRVTPGEQSPYNSGRKTSTANTSKVIVILFSSLHLPVMASRLVWSVLSNSNFILCSVSELLLPMGQKEMKHMFLFWMKMKHIFCLSS